MTLDAISAFLDSSPTIRLLKADLGAYVVFFLRQSFKANHEDSAIAFSHDDLIHRLQCFQDELRDEDQQALVGSADRYLREWSDAGWLRRFLPADSSGAHYQLTRYSEDAIRFVDNALSRDSRLVGTESRLRLVIDTLVDLVRGASSDPDRRLKDLLAERQRIDDEIESVRGGGKVETYHPAQIRERFHTAVDLLKTLQGDFRAVEDRFEEIGRQVQRDALTDDRRRGQILATALDAEDLIKQQDEGVSFNAFVNFLFAPQAQAKLRETIAEVTRIDAICDQRSAVEHVRAMVPSLLAEADNVLRQTGRLSHTLRRLLDDQSVGHRKRTAEVLRDIRTMASRLKHQVESSDASPDIGMEIETTIGVASPFARPFWTPPQVFDVAVEMQVIDLATAQREARKLAGLQRLEWERMRDAIARETRRRPSIGLSELIKLRPLKVGIIEMVGWIQIAHEDGHRIDRDAEEEIHVTTQDAVTGKMTTLAVRVPVVTFHRTSEVANAPIRTKRPR
ncbi:hypothetical protein Poly51_29770 [Rubripirellula tenax]|uniref:DUF3375 domain-containing protein n=1 Tax=Rubripirellula tenax TaxID=2528015 RepID=A0A5C6FA44_9BACT|nr:DUF3375 domain-containing protein [Rubripirellula tenax]TWU57056.1 hypothetical protein Poly51_29770 [Rubripirellula tenax]